MALSPSADAAVPVPSSWNGTITGTVFGQAFTLPVDVEIGTPISGEANPIHVGVTTTTPGDQVGKLLLTSAQQVTTPYTLRTATLTYMTVAAGATQLTATLTDNHAAEQGVANVTFDAPNLSCTFQPLVCVPGPELMYFLDGATLGLTFNGNQMTGTVQGDGAGLIQIEPYPRVTYSGAINATRVGVTPVSTGGVGLSLDLTAKPVQRPLKQGAVVVSVGCDRDCSLAAKGKIVVAKPGRSSAESHLGAIGIALHGARRKVAAGKTATLRLKLGRTAKKRTRALLSSRASRSRVEAMITVTAKDASGTPTAKIGYVRLRR